MATITFVEPARRICYFSVIEIHHRLLRLRESDCLNRHAQSPDSAHYVFVKFLFLEICQTIFVGSTAIIFGCLLGEDLGGEGWRGCNPSLVSWLTPRVYRFFITKIIAYCWVFLLAPPPPLKKSWIRPCLLNQFHSSATFSMRAGQVDVSCKRDNRCLYIKMFVSLCQKDKDCRTNSLRKQPTSREVATWALAKRRLSNERRNSILMTRHYPDLGSASDWLKWNSLAFQPIRSTT